MKGGEGGVRGGGGGVEVEGGVRGVRWRVEKQ